MTMATLSIDRRFCGPPGSGNACAYSKQPWIRLETWRMAPPLRRPGWFGLVSRMRGPASG
jgi:hypothetical protein